MRTKGYVIISKRAWPVNDRGTFLFPRLITGVEGTSVRIAAFLIFIAEKICTAFLKTSNQIVPINNLDSIQ